MTTHCKPPAYSFFICTLPCYIWTYPPLSSSLDYINYISFLSSHYTSHTTVLLCSLLISISLLTPTASMGVSTHPVSVHFRILKPYDLFRHSQISVLLSISTGIPASIKCQLMKQLRNIDCQTFILLLWSLSIVIHHQIQLLT